MQPLYPLNRDHFVTGYPDFEFGPDPGAEQKYIFNTVKKIPVKNSTARKINTVTKSIR
jgi:hypothetical protein